MHAHTQVSLDPHAFLISLLRPLLVKEDASTYYMLLGFGVSKHNCSASSRCLVPKQSESLRRAPIGWAFGRDVQNVTHTLGRR